MRPFLGLQSLGKDIGALIVCLTVANMRVKRGGLVKHVMERTDIHLVHSSDGTKVNRPAVLNDFNGRLVVFEDADVHRWFTHGLEDKVK